MLKFGQIIDLASLDQMGDRKMVNDLNKKISGIEAKYEREIHKIKKGIAAVQEQMLKTIQDNTANLERIAQLTGQQQMLEGTEHKGISTRSGKWISSAGNRRAKAFSAACKIASKEVDALKAEINMLRRKGGHVYTPAVSAPGMGDMGPMLDDNMMQQEQDFQGTIIIWL